MVLILATSGLTPPVLAQSNGEAEARIPVTDPWMLEELGLGPDASNVYVTPEVHAYLLMSPAERAAIEGMDLALESQDEAAFGVEPSSAFGSTTGVTTIHASDFAPLSSDTSYVILGTGANLTCNSGTPFFQGVFKDLPHGARATVRRVWYNDTHATENLTVWLQRTCTPFFSEGPPETTILRMNTSVGAGGWGRFGPGNLLEEDIDNNSCIYALRVRLGNSNLNCSAGNQLGIAKASLSWRRQASPAPATATFGDVPTKPPVLPADRGARFLGDHRRMHPQQLLPRRPVDPWPHGRLPGHGTGAQLGRAVALTGATHAPSLRFGSALAGPSTSWTGKRVTEEARPRSRGTAA